jgi:hypothetical protein
MMYMVGIDTVIAKFNEMTALYLQDESRQVVKVHSSSDSALIALP